MMGLVICIAAVVGAIAYLWRRARAAMRLNAEKICEEFTRAFPGKCPLCSFARHHGDLKHDAPHNCPEGNSEPLDVPTARVIRRG